MMDRELNIFKHGAQWLRADFHLHTRADKKAFTDWDENVSFKKEFVQKLSEEGIKVGVITNHNKFDKEEYRSLAQKAKQEEILLLPGVELSVNEGASGVHACIVFDPGKWLENGEDYINRFLSQAFPDSTEDQRANNNAHSEWTLKELLEKLDDQYKKYKKDSFIVFAHVDNEKGIFNEIERTRLEGLIKNPLYKKFVLGYQKVRKRDRVQMLNEICEESDIPAFIEGCDAKKLEDIGKVSNDQNGNPVKSYLKLSAFSFEAIKLSLIQKEIRYARAENPPKSQNGRITSVRFETSNSRPLYEKSLHLNPDLNCLIGIRGSGKSSLFETLRYGLGKNLRDNSEDIEYKDRLIEYALGNRSGSVIIDFVDKYGKEYQIKRIHGQRIDLYKEGEKLPIFDIDENLLNILYFGQKDLSSIGKEGFSEALIEKFFGDNLSEKREDIENKKNNVFQILDKIKGTENLSQQLEEANQQIATIDEKLQIFKDHKIDDKLKGEAQHNQDLQELNNWIEHVRALKADIQNIVEQHQYTIGKELQLHNSSNEELDRKSVV